MGWWERSSTGGGELHKPMKLARRLLQPGIWGPVEMRFLSPRRPPCWVTPQPSNRPLQCPARLQGGPSSSAPVAKPLSAGHDLVHLGPGNGSCPRSRHPTSLSRTACQVRHACPSLENETATCRRAQATLLRPLWPVLLILNAADILNGNGISGGLGAQCLESWTQ